MALQANLNIQSHQLILRLFLRLNTYKMVMSFTIQTIVPLSNFVLDENMNLSIKEITNK